MYSRRDFGKLALAGLPLSIASAQSRSGNASGKWIDSVIGGVQIGAQSYSFRELPPDEMIAAFAKIGLGECELWQGNIEPPEPNPFHAPYPWQPPLVNREELRAWRLNTPLDFYRDLKAKFDAAGVRLYAYNYSFKDDFTDEEIELGFQAAKAMDCELITASSTVSVTPRLVPFAEKHGMPIAFHNHEKAEETNEYATPDRFEKAMSLSDLFMINLDIGHFVAAGFDPVDYIREHHAKIPVIHLKDRPSNTRERTANSPWGEGDTPIVEVLQLIQREHYPIIANIEYEYRGKSDPVTEVTKCFDYCKEALT